MLFIVGCFLIGITAGLTSGLLGIGGGSIIVPALMFLFHYSGSAPRLAMHMAVGTSLATMVVTVSVSLVYFINKKLVDWHLVVNMLPGIISGSIAGAVLSHFLHTQVLQILFGVLLLAIALQIVFKNKMTGERQDLPSVRVQRFVAFGIGCLSGLLGIGGGTSCLPFLLYCNVPLRNSIGVSAAVSLVAAVFGALSVMITGLYASGLPPYSTGYVYWPAFLGIVLMSPIVAPLAARLGQVIPVDTVKGILAVFLIVIGLKMII